MTKDEALKMAIELLESPHITEQRINEVAQACKEALEQPAQEPVGLKQIFDLSIEIQKVSKEKNHE